IGAGADLLDGAALGGGGRLEGADLGAGEGGELGAVSGVIEDAGEAGMDRVNVIAAVEVVVDEDLPVAGEVVRAAADEVEALQAGRGEPLRGLGEEVSEGEGRRGDGVGP